MNPFGITERKYRKSDYQFVIGLIEKTIRKYLEKYYTWDAERIRKSVTGEHEKHTTILMMGNKRIGFYEARPEGKTLDITRIFLIPACQGKGIGTWYLKHFETLGYKKIELRVWANNPARFLYRKLGFKTVKKKDHKFHMEKIIRK